MADHDPRTDAMINMRNDITDIQKRIVAHDVLVTRFDTALDKISEVSLNVSRLLAVHEQRLESSEENVKELPRLIESRHQESTKRFDLAHERMTSMEQELRKDMTNGQREILDEIKNLRHDVTERTEALKTELSEDFEEKIERVDGRVSKLERLVYIAVGGATVIGFIISETVSYLGGSHK